MWPHVGTASCKCGSGPEGWDWAVDREQTIRNLLVDDQAQAEKKAE
jgi:hypothetical protein